MTGLGFWDSEEGRLIRWRARYARRRRLLLEGEPLRHGSRRERRHRPTDFVHGVAQLRQLRHGVLTGPVALDLDFHMATEQPPQLHHIAKRYLDLLGAAPPDTPPGGRRHLLYRDDRQVRLLHVRAWQPLDDDPEPGTGHTAVVAWPLRDVLADLEVAGSLRDHPLWDDADSPFHVPDLPEADLSPTFDLRQATAPAQVQRWTDLNVWLRLHGQSQMQEALFGTADALIASVLCRSRGLLDPNRHRAGAASKRLDALFADIAASDRATLLSHPLHIPLPALPTAHGERASFRTGLREQLQRWRARWPVFTPLLVPVKATLLAVTPPHGKDLDNLVRDDVLPTVHEVLAPQPAPWLTRFPQLTLNEQATWRPQHRRLQQLQQNSVTAYEVIQLARGPADQDGGVLRLALGNATSPGSTWARIAGFVQTHIERLQLQQLNPDDSRRCTRRPYG